MDGSVALLGRGVATATDVVALDVAAYLLTSQGSPGNQDGRCSVALGIDILRRPSGNWSEKDFKYYNFVPCYVMEYCLYQMNTFLLH